MANNCNNNSPDSLFREISPSARDISPSTTHLATNAPNTSVGSNPYSMCEYKMTPNLLPQSLNITFKFLSPAASSGPFCRICHEGDTQEDLISLCKCTGSLGLVHLSCMERWLSTRRNTSGPDRCEICNFTFETVRYPKSIIEWYHSEQGPLVARHGILGDIACFSLITPLAVVSAFLCLDGARKNVMWNNSLEAGCLMALATFLITVYVVWNVLTIRYHLKNYYKWRSINQNVRLVRFRRKSSREPNDLQTVVTLQESQSATSRTELATNNPQIQLDQQNATGAGDNNAQTSNACLAEA